LRQKDDDDDVKAAWRNLETAIWDESAMKTRASKLCTSEYAGLPGLGKRN